MADAEYRRLTCGACNAGFTQLPKGRPAKTCEPCRSTPERNCVRCDSKLPKGHTKWCSTRCKDGTKLTREQYRKSVRGKAKGAFTCRCCGVESYRGLSSTNKKRGTGNAFCSMACRVMHTAKVRAEVEAIRRIGSNECDAKRRMRSEKTRVIKSIAIALNKVARAKARASKPCVVCGVPCGGGRTLARTYCSENCRKQTEAYKDSKRRTKSKRRAVERGCKEARSIDPLKVFDRDGWRCQICLKQTPRKLRGTFHPRAPELDHVVPISKGGTHTWENLQCSCRDCNGRKGNKTNAGQMGLFTSLMP
jgi:5-methylcytosine-specific restriction endonuclease McrA